MQTFQIPLAALALPGDSGDSITPEGGDQLEVTATLRIDGVQGDLATVTVLALGGEPVAIDGGEPEQSEDDMLMEEESELDNMYADLR